MHGFTVGCKYPNIVSTSESLVSARRVQVILRPAAEMASGQVEICTQHFFSQEVKTSHAEFTFYWSS